MRKLIDHVFVRAGARIALACGLGCVLGAAEPATPSKMNVQMADVLPLRQQVEAPPKVTLQPAMYQPAPIPDPDADAPHSAGGPESPSLLPSLLSEKRVFDGDGYAYSSSQAGALSHRTTPAAGLNLSVPVGQQVGHAPGTGD
jgi:hypothetical protein